MTTFARRSVLALVAAALGFLALSTPSSAIPTHRSSASAAAGDARPSGASGKAGVFWTTAWKAPVTTAGPNRFASPPVLVGTASYALGPTTRVDVTTSAPSGLPAACGTFPAASVASLSGSTFTAKPAVACNGTYDVEAVAQSGTGLLAATAPALTAPVSVADPGKAVSGFSGVVDGAHRRVTLSWNADRDPDVVGYRVRRDGVAVADVGPDQRVHTDVVPGPGTFAYDVVTLRWGAGGPGSASISSPPTSSLVATVSPDAPVVPVAPVGGSGGSGARSSGSTPAASTTSSRSAGAVGAKHGTPPPARTASAHLPAGSTAAVTAGSRSGYRSGGTISADVPSTTLDDGFQEQLPYRAGSSRSRYSVTDPARTQAVSQTVSVPKRVRPGLVAPLAVLLVLVAASLQVRSLLGRAQAASRDS